MDILQDAVEPFGLTASKLLEDPAASRILRSNTAEAAGRGAFGVPGCVHLECNVATQCQGNYCCRQGRDDREFSVRNRKE